ncbi:reverse transcriptase domain-containing protein [Tanacetum coccineum]
MKRYGVNRRFSTSYHPQTSGQVENANRALKRILEKTVKDNPAIWSRKLDDALWAFHTAYKTPTGTTPYKIIYGKNYHLPFEIEHRAYWALKNYNPDLIAVGEKRITTLNPYSTATQFGGVTDIPSICPSFCKHKIQLLDDKKPVVQKQRRLNPNMQEVVKKEIVKLLDTGIIYPIADSPWVSPIHCVPKKGGITVVTNKNDELVPTRTITGWRVCIDYRKLNEATAKDHFPLPFMDQMLERLAGNKYFCFLDGFSGYFQIPIDPNDQEKTIFTCPFETYAYRRMPFGL